MMSILSYLLGSGWLSNQRPALHCHSTCSRSPDHSRAHHCFFFSFSSTVACFLSFVDRRPADSRQTKPAKVTFSKPGFGVFHVTQDILLSYHVQRTNPHDTNNWETKQSAVRQVLLCFFHHCDCGHNVIIPLYQTISLFQFPIRVSFA